MKLVNAIGEVCPKPVILTKHELDQMETGVVETLVDDMVCVNNLQRYAEGQGFTFSYEELEDGNFKTHIEKTEANKPKNEEMVFGNGKLTVAFGANTMGKGEEELGKILIKSLMYTISETDPLPHTLVFYNSGVFLTTEGSPVLDDIKKMEEQGVEVISCGTCLDYYQLKEKLQVGEISNMYTIYEKLSDPTKCVIIR